MKGKYRTHWYRRCEACRRPWDGGRFYHKHRKDHCELCGFKAVIPGQLDVDHRIPKSLGGSSRPENLWTLCANCHRLKTYIERL